MTYGNRSPGLSAAGPEAWVQSSAEEFTGISFYRRWP